MTTTTDRAKIVERLREGKFYDMTPVGLKHCGTSAADLIEQDGQRIAALEAEIAKLKDTE